MIVLKSRKNISRKNILLLIIVFSLLLYSFRDSSIFYFGPSYDNGSLVPGRNQIIIEHDGLNRTFWVETPSSYSPDQNYPVLFYFHFLGSTGGTTTMENLVNGENIIGVYPDGVNNTWNAGLITSDQAGSVADDYGFTLKILDWMKDNTRINENKLYAFGVSAGAIFLYEQIASRPNDFAAFALVMGNYFDCESSSYDFQRCVEGRPMIDYDRGVSILHIHGFMDRTVPYYGGPVGGYADEKLHFHSVDFAVDLWIDHNQCTAKPHIDEFLIPGVVISTYGDCNDSSEVKLYVLLNAGHGQLEDHLPESLDYGPVISIVWDFFEKHPKNKLL